MRHGHTARRFCLLAAALLLVSTTNIAQATTRTICPNDQLMTLSAADIEFEFVRIPAGRFLMGSSSGDSDERPVHEVRIDYDLHMGRTEITVRQFRAFVEATGYKTDAERAGWAGTCPLPGLHSHQRDLDWRRPGFDSTDDHPVVVISHNDAMAFCRWLSEGTGRPVRLPTEAEWEYAARAGCQDGATEDVGDVAWYEENTSGARPVGARRANAWGLHDMLGNAWEWCLDVYRADYRGAPTDGSAWISDPSLPPSVWRYVLRGGSWAGPARQLSPSYRSRRIRNFSRPDTGFRIVLSTANPERRTDLPAASQDKSGPVTCTRDGQTGRTVLTASGVRFEFVRIPPGEFTMGGTGEIEKPWHKVRIGYEFEMGVTEVTIAQFRAFLEATGYITDGQKDGYSWLRQGAGDWECEDNPDWRFVTSDESEDHPAVLISWYDAMAFCRWLSVETGQEIRLPSEAEWEHACRAGTTGLYAGRIGEMGWSRHNSWGRVHPVAQKQPNAWGLYDMHGNVWEWCLDFFTTSYDGAPTDGRPRWNMDDPTDVVSRGGSFANPPGWLASGCRMGTWPSASHYNNGFRLVRILNDTGRSDHTSAQSGPGPLVPIQTDLPRPMYVGTEKDIRAPRTKPVQKDPGPPFLAPRGTRNVALGKPVSASDSDPVMGELKMITDGDKEAADGSFVELGPFVQHVTIDLEAEYEIYGIRLWHFHQEPRVYFDVIVQIADDPDFLTDVITIFNNDMDNSAGLGIGTDMHYVETHFGEILDAKGVRGRYVRLYSNGNSTNDVNHYVEVEVYGRPVRDEAPYVPLKIDLPRHRFTTGPLQVQDIPHLERYVSSRTLMVPRGVTNVALNKPVLAQADPVVGNLGMITDGRKDEGQELHVQLPAGVQYITIDLEATHTIYAVQVWHTLGQRTVYYDVIVQVSDDPDFIEEVHTVFNNDIDNSVGLGIGWDRHYVKSHVGLLVDAGGVRGRYVRLYSNGNNLNEFNHYVEVEVYGQVAEQTPRRIPLNTRYPLPTFISHRSADFMDRVPNVEKPSPKPPPLLMVPPRTRNVALGKPVVSSDAEPIVGKLEMITDGTKEYTPFVEWEPGLLHVTIDLEEHYAIYAIVVWHYHRAPRIYFDVIVQIADDAGFGPDATTVFNNDHDNSAGMGIGQDKHYVDTFQGKVIPVNGVQGRFVRLYSNGNDQNELNHYLEVEVYGRAVLPTAAH
jgi:formylglycine-generating enzyme required for sulfatase activity